MHVGIFDVRDDRPDELLHLSVEILFQSKRELSPLEEAPEDAADEIADYHSRCLERVTGDIFEHVRVADEIEGDTEDAE